MAKSPTRRSSAAASRQSVSAKAAARNTVSAPAHPARATSDAMARHAAGVQALAASFPVNANKPGEIGRNNALRPPEGKHAKPQAPAITGSTLSEANASAKTGSGKPTVGASPASQSLDRVRADSSDQVLTTNQGVAIADNQNSLEGRAARADAARRLHPAREDHPLRPRAHSRAHRSCARLGRARLLRVLQAAGEVHPCRAVCRSRQGHAGVRALLHGGRRARLGRHRARCARLRREVLHRRRQLGPGRQQHAGVLHSGRDEVPRPRACRQARAASRHAASRVGARHVLGLRFADARVDPHADVGDVRSRDPAQLAHDARASACTPSGW